MRICLLVWFSFELYHDAAKWQLSNILHRVNDSRIERCSILNDVANDFRLTVGPLLQPRTIELYHYALPMTMARSRVSHCQAFLEDEQARTVVKILKGYDLSRAYVVVLGDLNEDTSIAFKSLAPLTSRTFTR